MASRQGTPAPARPAASGGDNDAARPGEDARAETVRQVTRPGVTGPHGRKARPSIWKLWTYWRAGQIVRGAVQEGERQKAEFQQDWSSYETPLWPKTLRFPLRNAHTETGAPSASA
jgi:hypothetical protein